MQHTNAMQVNAAHKVFTILKEKDGKIGQGSLSSRTLTVGQVWLNSGIPYQPWIRSTLDPINPGSNKASLPQASSLGRLRLQPPKMKGSFWEYEGRSTQLLREFRAWVGAKNASRSLRMEPRPTSKTLAYVPAKWLHRAGTRKNQLSGRRPAKVVGLATADGA